jgi:hypothetical protein
LARANKVELERRLDLATDMLAKGHSGTSVVTFMSQEEGLSRRQSQRIVSNAYQILVSDVTQIGLDRKELVSQLVVNLQAGIQKSLDLGHVSAMVACVRTLNDLCGLGASKETAMSRRFR